VQDIYFFLFRFSLFIIHVQCDHGTKTILMTILSVLKYTACKNPLFSPYRIPASISAEPRSSRLKDKKKGEGETVIKELFVQDVLQNNDLLHILGKGSAVVLLPRSSVDISVCSKLRVGSQQSINVSNSEGMHSSKGFVSDDLVFNRSHGIKQEKSFYCVKDKFTTMYERNRISSFDVNGNFSTSSSKPLQRDTEGETSEEDGLSDQRLFSCVTCGILSFSCVAIVQPRDPTARYLMSSDCSFFNDSVVGSGVSNSKFTTASEEATIHVPNTYTGRFISSTISSISYFVSYCHKKIVSFSSDVISNDVTS